MAAITNPALNPGGALTARPDEETPSEFAAEHLSLRRIAELVAKGAPQGDVFAAVAIEASRLIKENTSLLRVEHDGDYTVIADCGGLAAVGTQITVAEDDEGLLAEIARTRRPARRDDYAGRGGPAVALDRFGVRSAAGVPVIVDDLIWGVMVTTTVDGRPLPLGTESRLAQFAELIAAALANAQARSDLQRIVDEQIALRQVAELVARTAPTEEIFAAVARNASARLDDAPMTLTRYTSDGRLIVVASHGGPAEIGTRIEYAPDTLPDRIRRTGQPVRVDDYRREPDAEMAVEFSIAAAVSVPISVDKDVWGMLTVTSGSAPLPTGTEERLGQFAGLVTAALSDVQARTELQSLASEQAAFRRIAELVARGVDPDAVFTAVAAEASHLHGDLGAVLARYEADGAIVLATCNSRIPLGHRSPTLPGTALGEILRTGVPVRLDSTQDIALAAAARRQGVAAGVAVPIIVEGRIWGVLATTSAGPPLAKGTEDRLTSFAELTAASIANAEYRHRLTASRARVIASADETRRRLQRDVHDSAQQRLVHAVITLKLAKTAIMAGDPNGDVANLIDEALQNAQRANKELRDVVRGILPTALTYGGLRAGLRYLVDDFPLPVELDADIRRLATETETTAYFVVAETLTNVVKHAHATAATVKLTVVDTDLAIEVRDDGVGGANPGQGSGLIGLIDRVEANNGTLVISSPAGSGTTVHAVIPIHPPGARPYSTGWDASRSGSRR